MKQAWLLFFILPFLIACRIVNVFGETESKKWIPLFNGTNLDNWTPKMAGHQLGENYRNTFRVANGLLQVRYNEYDSFKNTFGALYFSKPYSNFRLKVEYRFVGDTTRGAPSWGFRDGGIQYYGQDPKSIGLEQPFPVCLEYNLHGGNGTEERPTGEICANGIFVEIAGQRNASYCTPPTVKRTFHGDSWVTAEVEVRSGTITHFVNGEKILEFKKPQYDSANAFSKALIKMGNSAVTGGFISLQSNSHPMDFRKIELLEY